jgi:phospholipid-binding lipoprotein MlaA
MKKSLLLVLFICIYLTFPVLARDLETKYDKDNIFIEKDPLISFNKPVYVFNDKLYRYIARPVTKIWASVFPSYFMTRIDKFADNMAFPVRFVSCVAQGKFKDSGVETTRFLTNTTLGIAGFYDPANYYFDLRKKDESIAQVLQRWGLASGPYLVLPFYGSSDIRGLGGTLFDKALNPLTYVPGSGAIIGINKATGYIDKALKIDMIYYNPYEASKYYYAIRNYIKFEDYDRQHVFIQKNRQFNSKNQSEFNKPINNKTFANANETNELVESVKYYFNPIIRPKKTFWSKQAVWNKDFSKQFKFKELKIDKNKSVYNYRFINQKNHNSPLVHTIFVQIQHIFESLPLLQNPELL